MNDLKWADVAQNYLKSNIDVSVSYPDGKVSVVRKLGIYDVDGNGMCITPILRHLEDMTEAQAVELWNYGRGQDWINMQHTSDIYYDSPLCWYRFNRFGDINRQFTAKETYWLYKNGFDIHGLIESEQAIRRPKD